MRNQQQADDDAPDHVADHQLEEAKVLLIGHSRHADDGQRTGLGRNDRQGDGPPGNRFFGKEVAFDGVLLLLKVHSEGRDAGQVQHNHGNIESIQAHGVSFSGSSWRSVFTPAIRNAPAPCSGLDVSARGGAAHCEMRSEGRQYQMRFAILNCSRSQERPFDSGTVIVDRHLHYSRIREQNPATRLDFYRLAIPRLTGWLQMQNGVPEGTPFRVSGRNPEVSR